MLEEPEEGADRTDVLGPDEESVTVSPFPLQTSVLFVTKSSPHLKIAGYQSRFPALTQLR